MKPIDSSKFRANGWPTNPPFTRRPSVAFGIMTPPPDTGPNGQPQPRGHMVRVDGKNILIENGGASGDPPYPPCCDWESDKIRGYFYWMREQCDGDGLKALERYTQDDMNKDRPWASTAAVLSALPLEEIVALGPDKLEALANFPGPEEVVQNSPEEAAIRKARARLDSVLPSGIMRRADGLTHKKPEEVRDWGKALDAVRLKVLKALKPDTGAAFQTLKAEQPGSALTRDLKNLLTAKRPVGLRGVFYTVTRVWTGRDREVGRHRGTAYDYDSRPLYERGDVKDPRSMTPEQKATRAAEIIGQLETLYRGQIDQIERALPPARSAHEQAVLYRNITKAYARSLKERREDLIEEESDFLSAKAPDTASNASLLRDGLTRAAGIAADVDLRLEALDLSVDACEREEKYFRATIAQLEEGRDSRQFYLDRVLPAMRAQYDAAYLKAMKRELGTDPETAALLGALSPVRRDAKAWELAMAPVLEEVEGLMTVQERMEEREVLLIGGADPAALIEHHRPLAIPDLRSAAEKEKTGTEVSLPVPAEPSEREPF